MFWDNISSHTHAFVLLYSLLWNKFSKNQVFFSQKLFFPEFRLIQSNFQSIEILLLKFCEPLPGSIDRTFFSINRRSYFKFFLKQFFNCFKTSFSKVFQLFFSLRFGKAALRIFCRFPPKFLQGFPPSKPVRPFYPSFCFYFHVFMHLKGIFEPL